MANQLLRDILIIFLCSIPVAFFFQKLRQPAMLGFLVTGALIGPLGLGWIHEADQVEALADLGVTLLLFFVGLEFSPDSFIKMKRASILGGSLQIVLTILAGAVIGRLLGWDYAQSLFFGLILSLSSTTLVLTSLAHQRSLESVPGRVSTAILIMQDLAFIPIVALIPFIQRRGEIPFWQEMGRESLEAAALIVGAYLFAKFLARPLFYQIARTRSRELFAITVIALAIGFAWLTSLLGFSFALGAFAAGLIVGSTEFHYQALAEIQPFRFCFLSLFFVSVGMLLNPEVLKEHYRIIIGMVILLPLLKLLITTVALLITGLPLRIALTVGICLAQIGEFSFLIASSGRSMGILPRPTFQIIIAIAVLAMMVTPLMVKAAPRLANGLAKLPGLRRLTRKSLEVGFQEEVERLSGHVIICGFGPLGQTFGNILHAHDTPFLVLELNPDTIKKVREKNRPAFFGDGASEDLLFDAGIERAKLLAITVPDYLNAAAIIRAARRLNPEIRIFTRAKYRNEVEKLYEAGADAVISEELEGGIELSRLTLLELGLRPEEVEPYIHKIRDFGSADFF